MQIKSVSNFFYTIYMFRKIFGPKREPLIDHSIEHHTAHHFFDYIDNMKEDTYRSHLNTQRIRPDLNRHRESFITRTSQFHNPNINRGNSEFQINSGGDRDGASADDIRQMIQIDQMIEAEANR